MPGLKAGVSAVETAIWESDCAEEWIYKHTPNTWDGPEQAKVMGMLSVLLQDG